MCHSQLAQQRLSLEVRTSLLREKEPPLQVKSTLMALQNDKDTVEALPGALDRFRIQDPVPCSNERRTRMPFGSPARCVALIAVLFLVGAGWHYWVIYSNLAHAKSDLLGAREILAGEQLDFDAAQTGRAQARLDSADGNLSRARTHLRWDPFLQVGRRLPFAGRQVDAVY
ncbi:MAG: hypothetical protein ACM3S1_06780, partial [Hyphomicrobiales bacterium]